jgi:hypothetical protein
MNCPYGGLIPVIIYGIGITSSNSLNQINILTEDSLDILTELNQLIAWLGSR